MGIDILTDVLTHDVYRQTRGNLPEGFFRTSCGGHLTPPANGLCRDKGTGLPIPLTHRRTPAAANAHATGNNNYHIF